MLVLSRNVKQTIRIGDDIEVTVLQLQGNRVVIGLQAPKSMRILRGELQAFRDECKDSVQTLLQPVVGKSTAIAS